MAPLLLAKPTAKRLLKQAGSSSGLEGSAGFRMSHKGVHNYQILYNPSIHDGSSQARKELEAQEVKEAKTAFGIDNFPAI